MVFILSIAQNPKELSRYLESVDRSEFIREANRPQILSPAWSSLSSPQHSTRGKFQNSLRLLIWNVPRDTFQLLSTSGYKIAKKENGKHDYFLFTYCIFQNQMFARAGIFKPCMGARNRVRIGLSYRPASLHKLSEFIPWNRFLGSINI